MKYQSILAAMAIVGMGFAQHGFQAHVQANAPGTAGAPSTPPPAGCQLSYQGPFQVAVINRGGHIKRDATDNGIVLDSSDKAFAANNLGDLTPVMSAGFGDVNNKFAVYLDETGSVELYNAFDDNNDAQKGNNKFKRDSDGCGSNGVLVTTLKDGILLDNQSRTGYIASNYQFQFDKPAQAGAIYAAGFSVCSNGSLALGGSTVFWECRSGNFWNLYDRYWAPQCSPIDIVVMPCYGQGNQGIPSGVQPVGTQLMTTTIVKPLADGQPQVLTTMVPVPMCQIGDGQVEAHTIPCASIPTGSIDSPAKELPDGQVITPPLVTPAPTLPNGYGTNVVDTDDNPLNGIPTPVRVNAADHVVGLANQAVVALVGAVAVLVAMAAV